MLTKSQGICSVSSNIAITFLAQIILKEQYYACIWFKNIDPQQEKLK